MNYLEQIKGFWIAQEAHQLGTSEIAMYFYLLEICNKTGWTGSFKRNNCKVMADLSIKSYKTMQSVRDRLKAADILDYNQRNGDANVSYRLFDLGKFYRGTGEGSGKGSVKGMGKGSGEVNINQTKPNQTKQPFPPATPPAPKKKADKKGEEKSLYWDVFVKTFQDFYTRELGREPYEFTSKDFGCLKKIYQFLEKRAHLKSFKWTEENMTGAFQFFLNAAKNKDNWMRENFSIPNLLSQFNQIANGGQQRSANAQGGKSAAGAKIDGAVLDEAFAKFYKKAG